MGNTIKKPESLKSALNRDANKRAKEIRKTLSKSSENSLRHSYRADKFSNFLASKEKGKKHPELMNKAFPGSVDNLKKTSHVYGGVRYQSAGGKVSKAYKACGANIITGR